MSVTRGIQISVEELQSQGTYFILDSATINAGIVIAKALNVHLLGHFLAFIGAWRDKIVVPHLPWNFNQSSTFDQSRIPLRIGCRRGHCIGGANHNLDWNMDIRDVVGGKAAAKHGRQGKHRADSRFAVRITGMLQGLLHDGVGLLELLEQLRRVRILGLRAAGEIARR